MSGGGSPFPPGGILQPGVQPGTRPATKSEIAQAKRNKRLSEIVTFAANLLQNAVRSGNLTISMPAETGVEFSDAHIEASIRHSASFFAAVDEMVAKSDRLDSDA